MLEDVFSWKDPKFTVKALLATLIVFGETFLLGDAAFLWLACNFCLLWPLAHQKKGKEIDGFISNIN